MKDDNKVHATDTLKEFGQDITEGKEGLKDMKATMQADYEQTKEDMHNLHNKVTGKPEDSGEVE